MTAIDKFSYQSKLRYINASEKFVYAMLTLMQCVVGRSVHAAVLVFGVNVFLTVKKGGIPLLRYVMFLIIPSGFILLSFAAVVLNFSEYPLDAFVVSVGSFYITGSSYMIEKMAKLSITALACVSCLYFLALNTTMTDIINVLRKIHIPDLVIELMILTYRYIFLLFDTAEAILTAQNSRLGNRNFRTEIYSYGSMASALFVYSIKRSGALYDAMESRCYDGVLRVLPTDQRPEKKEIMFIIFFEIILLAVTVWSTAL